MAIHKFRDDCALQVASLAQSAIETKAGIEQCWVSDYPDQQVVTVYWYGSYLFGLQNYIDYIGLSWKNGTWRNKEIVYLPMTAAMRACCTKANKSVAAFDDTGHYHKDWNELNVYLRVMHTRSATLSLVNAKEEE